MYDIRFSFCVCICGKYQGNNQTYGRMYHMYLLKTSIQVKIDLITRDLV